MDFLAFFAAVLFVTSITTILKVKRLKGDSHMKGILKRYQNYVFYGRGLNLFSHVLQGRPSFKKEYRKMS